MNTPRARTPQAVTLRYTGMGAPQVTAKAEGVLVEAMLALAERHGIPRHRDPLLTGLLAQVRLDDAIPPELYTAVAAVLAMVYASAGRMPPGMPARTNSNDAD